LVQTSNLSGFSDQNSSGDTEQSKLENSNAQHKNGGS